MFNNASQQRITPGIGTWVNNSGSYTWHVETPTLLNDSYTIQVVSSYDNNIVAHSAIFSIVNPGLTVTNPTNGTVWVKSHTYSINWTFAGTYDDYDSVDIYLFNNASQQRLTPGIWTYANNSGSFTWDVSTVTLVNDSYTIQIVSSYDSSIVAHSDIFSIVNPVINVTNPTVGTVWVKSLTYTINWTFSGLYTDYDSVDIYLFNNASQQRLMTPMIGTYINNSESFTWHVSTLTLPNTPYTI